MTVALLSVPYHLGREGVGPGLGPGRLLAGGAEQLLRGEGRRVEVVNIERRGPFLDEASAVIDVAAGVAAATRTALDGGALPVVLAGDCCAVLGVLAAAGTDRTGLLWFDAHGDFNTPQISQSGFLDGMALAMACGHCYADELREEIAMSPVPECHVVHVGGRDIDPEERRAMDASELSVISALRLVREGADDALIPALAALSGRTGCRPRRIGEQRGVTGIHVHVDLDVIDPRLAPAVDYPAPGGLDPEEVLEVVAAVVRRTPLTGISLSQYDPSLPDPDERTQMQALDLLRELVAHAGAAA